MCQIRREIEISNFGPINHVILDLNKTYQIYIGAQASGKSTICKVIYFCEKIRDYSLTFMLEEVRKTNNDASHLWGDYMNYLKKQFMGCFGKTTHMKPFTICYKFAEHEIVITLQDGFVNYRFSDNLFHLMCTYIKDAYSMQKQLDGSKGYLAIFDRLNEYQMMKEQFQVKLEELFSDRREILYIPAGRSLLATLSEQLQDYSVSDMDLTMQEFINLIRRSKSQFGNKIPEMVREYTKTVDRNIDRQSVENAYELIRKILKADYKSDSEGEKIYFDEYHWVKLMYSSSGQQEVLWILMLLFVLILQRKSAFVVIEEPEAHLFPIAQKDVMEFITLMTNVTSSSILLTTHSPYILTSANILLYSSQVEGEGTDYIIPPNKRIDCNNFEAYKIVYDVVQGSMMESIFDKDTALIDTEYIDEVSCITNRTFDELIEVSVKRDL